MEPKNVNASRMRIGAIVLFALFSVALAAAVHAQPRQTDPNLPLPPPQLMKLLESGEFKILSGEETGYSTQGSQKLSLAFSNEPQTIKVKWKPAPKGKGEAWNNSPRREVAAYFIQQLFLDPPDYVVPPTTIRCMTLTQERTMTPDATPNVEPFKCVYGTFAAWLSNVDTPNDVYDQERFAKDKRYAYHMANMNLLDYLINHQDAVNSNYLYSTDPANPKVFSIDNGLSLKQGWHNPFLKSMNKIRVSALPKQSIDRLRKVTAADLDRLGVLQQMDADANGMLHIVEPRENLDPKAGSRVRPDTLQIGLTREEIELVRMRLQTLLQWVDQGKWELF